MRWPEGNAYEAGRSSRYLMYGDSLERPFMDTKQSTGAVLEILQTGNPTEWRLEPDKPTEYSVIVRNETAETHDVELAVVDAIDWATVQPSRLSLRPGREAKTKVILLPGVEARVSAGVRSLTLELQDFEGTCLGQLVTSILIVPYYRLVMALRMRGPLLRRGVGEGFVLSCIVFNHGNAECSVEARADEDTCFSFNTPPVQVPVGGSVSFDIEAHWKSNPLLSYPDAVRVRASYPGGEVTAELPWQEVAASLGSLIPPLKEETEFPELLAISRHELQATVLPPTVDEPSKDAPEDRLPTMPGPAKTAHEESSPEPMRVQIAAKPAMKYTYGRRVNPWWPPAERFGGRWRVKLFPILALLIITTAIGLAKFAHERPTSTTLSKLQVNILTLLHFQKTHPPRAAHAVAGHAHSAAPPLGQRHKLPSLHEQHIAAKSSHRYVAMMTTQPGPSTARVSAANQRPNVPALLQATAKHPKGSVWEGRVIHVSADNIKVLDMSGGTARSFIVSQGFKSVFSADGMVAYSMAEVHPGTEVRIFYSYVLGVRHPNAIFILSQPK